jgi:colanic acid/amylovoran biosynthesis glycosyltransferase
MMYTESRIKWVLKLVQELQPDIFIPNLDIPSLYASRWIRESGIPTIGILRSDEERYKGILDMFVTKRSPYVLSGLVCVSRYLEEFARERNPNAVQIKRIPSGTPIPSKTAIFNGGRMRLIYSGRLVEIQKQISNTTLALLRAVREVPDTEAVIYGSGPDEPSVAKIVSDADGTNPLKLGGRVDPENIMDILQEGHIFVLLSDFEGLPVSLMEAMAAGLVPVCLNIRSGVPELVVNNKTGLLVSDRSDDFVMAIRKLRSNPDLWKKLSRAARNKIESEYSYKVAADRWIEFFNELLKPGSTIRTNIRINGFPELPVVHPLLKKSDHRWPGYFQHLFTKTRKKTLRLTRFFTG